MLPDILWKESSGLEKVWNDAGSRSPGDLTIWRAKLSTAEKNEGWRRLGDIAVPSMSYPSFKGILVKDNTANGALKRPQKSSKIWVDGPLGKEFMGWDGMIDFGADKSVTVSRMNPYSGYKCIGNIAYGAIHTDLNEYACVKDEYVTESKSFKLKQVFFYV